MHAFVIGGTRFMGRFTVGQLREAGHEVTLFTRGQTDNPFTEDEGVHHLRGDRTDPDGLREAADTVDYDRVFDFVAYYPEDVRIATDIFADAGAYVYISSASVYGDPAIPLREGETSLVTMTRLARAQTWIWSAKPERRFHRK